MSARQPVTIGDLPPEVLGRAIAFLRDPLDDFAQPEQTVQSLGNLLAASLVSKLWSELAQHELCARLEVPRSELMDNRAGWWIASPARKKFKTFELRLPGGHDAPWMGEVLAACPDVRRLTLLQAESIDRGSWKALQFLPKLTQLKIVAECLQRDDDTSPLPFRLTHFSLNVWGPLNSPIIVSRIFQSSIATLTSLNLNFGYGPSSDLILPLLPLVGASLHHFTFDANFGPEDLPYFKTLTALLSLDLPSIDTICDLRYIAEALPLPPTLHSLSFLVSSPEEDLNMLLEFPTFSEIRRFKLQEMARTAMDEAFLQACEAREIQVVTLHEPVAI